MTDLEQRVTERLEALRQEIVANIEQKGITASGRTQRSLQVVQYNGGAKLIAAAGDRAPLETLEIGREGGKVPRGFTDILMQWSKDKNLFFESDKDRRRFAFLLGRRIAKGNTEYPLGGTMRHYRAENVYTDAVQRATEDIKGIILADVRETISKHFTGQNG